MVVLVIATVISHTFVLRRPLVHHSPTNTFACDRIASVLVVPIAAQIGHQMEVPHERLLILATALICSCGMGLVRSPSSSSPLPNGTLTLPPLPPADQWIPEPPGDQPGGRRREAVPRAGRLFQEWHPGVYRRGCRHYHRRVPHHARDGVVGKNIERERACTFPLLGLLGGDGAWSATIGASLGEVGPGRSRTIEDQEDIRFLNERAVPAGRRRASAVLAGRRAAPCFASVFPSGEF